MGDPPPPRAGVGVGAVDTEQGQHSRSLQIHLFQCCVQSPSGREGGNPVPHSGTVPLCPQCVPHHRSICSLR